MNKLPQTMYGDPSAYYDDRKLPDVEELREMPIHKLIEFIPEKNYNTFRDEIIYLLKLWED